VWFRISKPLAASLLLVATYGWSQEAVNPIEIEMGAKLLKLKRVYVDALGEDKASKTMQAMLINALTSSGRFIVTESRDKADGILKGASNEKSRQELFSKSEGTSVGVVGGGFSANTGHASGGFGGVGLSQDDSVTQTETIDHAALSVRLVAADGDTIWSTTQESKGAKYKGAGADVVDKIVKQLLRDIERFSKRLDPKAAK